MNQLEGLKQFTTVVADSEDIKFIRHYTPQDTTTNPSLILKAASLTIYQTLFKDALAYARKQGNTRKTQIINASDKLVINIGVEILKNVPGRVFTEVDARLSFDRCMCVAKARKLVALYQEQIIDKSRILIKLTSTWEGIQAAKELGKEGINCNLTQLFSLAFSLAQTCACAEAGVYLISPFVGRIYDWYNQRKPLDPYVVDEDPGVVSVRKIYDYYKQHCYQIVIIGASFRKVEQILALAGCDYLTIFHALLEELYKSDGHVERKLSPSTEDFHQPAPLFESEFRWEHNQDAMALDKLAEGIRQFPFDQIKPRNLLAAKL